MIFIENETDECKCFIKNLIRMVVFMCMLSTGNNYKVYLNVTSDLSIVSSRLLDNHLTSVCDFFFILSNDACINDMVFLLS